MSSVGQVNSILEECTTASFIFRFKLIFESFLTCLSSSQPALWSNTPRVQRPHPRRDAHLIFFTPLTYMTIDTESNDPNIEGTGEITDLLLLFLPRQENHHLPPFLGIFSFMMLSTAAWSRAQSTPKPPQDKKGKKKTLKELKPNWTVNQQTVT